MNRNPLRKRGNDLRQITYCQLAMNHNPKRKRGNDLHQITRCQLAMNRNPKRKQVGKSPSLTLRVVIKSTDR